MPSLASTATLQFMNATRAVFLLLLFVAIRRSNAQPTPAATATFNAAAAAAESTLPHPLTFTPEQTQRLHNRQFLIEALPAATAPGALLHHWRGSAYLPHASATAFENLLRDFNAYPQRFAPDVLQAKVVGGAGDHLHALLRVRQKHVLTVVLDQEYDVDFARASPRAGRSASRSTHISEIDEAGHPLDDAHARGFLWRQNTYWTWEERDGGLIVQVESLSLSRAIPTGLGWAIRPYVERVPRESLEFTLRSATQALTP